MITKTQWFLNFIMALMFAFIIWQLSGTADRQMLSDTMERVSTLERRPENPNVRYDFPVGPYKGESMPAFTGDCQSQLNQVGYQIPRDKKNA